MTREKSKDMIIKGIYNGDINSGESFIENCIDKIYDDFESRVCNNCLYCEDDNETGIYCKNKFSLCFNIGTSGNFGCNKWEDKE